MPIHWRSQIDIDEENRYGRAGGPCDFCYRCNQLVKGDDWRGRPGHMLCGKCYAKELREEDLQHDADLERVPVAEK